MRFCHLSCNTSIIWYSNKKSCSNLFKAVKVKFKNRKLIHLTICDEIFIINLILIKLTFHTTLGVFFSSFTNLTHAIHVKPIYQHAQINPRIPRFKRKVNSILKLLAQLKKARKWYPKYWLKQNIPPSSAEFSCQTLLDSGWWCSLRFKAGWVTIARMTLVRSEEVTLAQSWPPAR